MTTYVRFAVYHEDQPHIILRTGCCASEDVQRQAHNQGERVTKVHVDTRTHSHCLDPSGAAVLK